MKYFVSILLLFGVFSKLCSEDLNEQNKEASPLTLIHIEEDESGADVGVIKPGLSSKTLSDVHHLAKNISHSKGIYRESGKSGGGKKVRRSILKKGEVAFESDTIKNILLIFDYVEDKLKLLQDMEFLVHQYDVAVTFATMGGMKIISPLLFSSNDKIVSSVALVLGAAMQSNPAVQKIAMDQDVGKNLLKLLSHKSSDVVSRILFALSSFLRNSPEAQEEFLSVNGVSKLVNILDNHHITTSTKLKIINLFNDLAIEQKTSEEYLNEKNAAIVPAHKRSFANEILKNDVCWYVSSFLSFEDYDTHQKVVAAMLALHSICHEEFKTGTINKRLKKLLKIYDPHSVERYPLYPYINRELKRSLHSELVDLILKVNEDSSNASAIYLLKTEL